jgi:hypothetical protein
MRLTQASPVSGQVQCSTMRGSPVLVQCSIITQVWRAPTARSIVPPTAGMASGAPVCSLARSPWAVIWKAPRTQTPPWPRRIMPKPPIITVVPSATSTRVRAGVGTIWSIMG